MDLTVVIPLYNRKEYIKATLDSICQSGTDIRQIIIVDNNSTDGSFEYASKISELYSTDITVARETVQGAAAARNRGLELCQTKWIYFFDSDDIFTGLPSSWDTDKDLICIPTRQKSGKRLDTRPYSPVCTPHTQILSSMLNTISMIFSTEYLRRIGGWNTKCRIWDDWELGIRALIGTKRVQWITAKAYHQILVHQDSVTGSSFSEGYTKALATLSIAFDDICAMLESKEKDRCQFAFFLRCYILSGNLLKEGNTSASEEVHTLINKYFHVGKQDYKMGHFIEWYVSKGFRGAWKIALWITEHI